MKTLGCLTATFAALATGIVLASAQPVSMSAPSSQAWNQGRVIQVGWFKDLFKTAADKATDADKIAFLKQEGQLSADMVDSDGHLTASGNAAFDRLKSVYNEQNGLYRSGYQRISASQGRKLMALEIVVNNKILNMQNDCLNFINTINSIDTKQNNSLTSSSCNFINKVEYVAKSGNSYFASQDGESALQAMSTN